VDNRYTRGLAEFASGLTYEAIPPEVRERLKLLILDALGCALYGAQLEWCHLLRSTLSSLDDTKTCGVWGTREPPRGPQWIAIAISAVSFAVWVLAMGGRFPGVTLPPDIAALVALVWATLVPVIYRGD